MLLIGEEQDKRIVAAITANETKDFKRRILTNNTPAAQWCL